MSQAAVRVRLLFRWLTVAVCLLQAYVTRNTMNPDGVSYLEVAQAYLRGDGGAALNFYWGPLLSVLLAGAQAVVPLGLEYEAALAHGVTFGCFVLSLLAFEWLLSEVLRLPLRLPDWAVVGVAYGSFAWVAHWGIKVEIITPDMLVAATAYAGVALVLCLRREPECRWAAPVLGCLLGLGFLAKTVVLVVAGLALLALVLTLPWQWGPRRAVVAGVMMLVFAGPYLALLSVHKGRLTAGESGRLNYFWEVADGPRPELLAVVEDRTTPPVRLLDAPPVVKLPTRPDVSYALWYDCTPWYEGVSRPFQFGQQVGAWGKALWAGAYVLRRTVLPMTAAVLLVVLASLFGRAGTLKTWWSEFVAGLGGAVPLLLVGVGTCLVYATTGVIEGRLAGPFLLLAFLGVVIALPAGSARACAGAVGLVFLAALATLGYEGYLIGTQGPVPHPHWAVVQRLRELGIEPGDGVGTIGSPYTAYWAHLARTPAVAEVPDGRERRFWEATPEQQALAWDAFRAAKARVVVAETGPRAGWEQIPGTRFAVRKLE